MTNNNAFHSMMVRAGRITYFIEVREAKNGSQYLSISEHRIDDNGRKDRRVIRIFAESCIPFSQAVTEAVSAIQQKVT